MQRRNTSARCLTCSRLIDQAAHSSSCPFDSRSPSRTAAKAQLPFSPLSSLSLFLCLCAFSTCTRIFASFDSRRNSAHFGQRRTALPAAALHTFSSWPSRAVQRSSSSSSQQQRSSQDNHSSRVFSLHCAHSSLVCAAVEWPIGRIARCAAAALTVHAAVRQPVARRMVTAPRWSSGSDIGAVRPSATRPCHRHSSSTRRALRPSHRRSALRSFAAAAACRQSVSGAALQRE